MDDQVNTLIGFYHYFGFIQKKFQHLEKLNFLFQWKSLSIKCNQIAAMIETCTRQINLSIIATQAKFLLLRRWLVIWKKFRQTHTYKRQYIGQIYGKGNKRTIYFLFLLAAKKKTKGKQLLSRNVINAQHVCIISLVHSLYVPLTDITMVYLYYSVLAVFYH